MTTGPIGVEAACLGSGPGGRRLRFHSKGGIVGGSWVVISGVISRATILITQIRGL